MLVFETRIKVKVLIINCTTRMNFVICNKIMYDYICKYDFNTVAAQNAFIN